MSKNGILCLTCNHCTSGERIDDCVDVFGCRVYGLKVFGVEKCKHYKKESLLKREDCNIGMPVLYVKSENHIELGIIKSFNNNGVPFVCYHTGSTAACTPYEMLRPLFNDYVFQIIRKDVNNNTETQKARRIALEIISKSKGVNDVFEVIDIITGVIENFKEEMK